MCLIIKKHKNNHLNSIIFHFVFVLTDLNEIINIMQQIILLIITNVPFVNSIEEQKSSFYVMTR